MPASSPLVKVEGKTSTLKETKLEDDLKKKNFSLLRTKFQIQKFFKKISKKISQTQRERERVEIFYKQ